MNKLNFNKEWEFITAEVHNKKSDKGSLLKREILFDLQILLSKMEVENYSNLKKIYCKN